jgi:hypothetical protein
MITDWNDRHDISQIINDYMMMTQIDICGSTSILPSSLRLDKPYGSTVSSLVQFSMGFIVSMHLHHHMQISGITAIHMVSPSLVIKSGRPLSRNHFIPFHYPQVSTSSFEMTSVAVTTTTSRLIVIVVVDFSRVGDRLDYDYSTDYNYDYRKCHSR